MLLKINHHNKIAITGPPRSGKTTFSESFSDRKIIHTDDWIGEGKDRQIADLLIRYCSGFRRYVIEGVHVAKALRRGLDVDVVVWIGNPRVYLPPRKAAMARSVDMTFRRWLRTSSKVPVFSIVKDGTFKKLN